MIEVAAVGDKSRARVGERFAVAEALRESVLKSAGITEHAVVEQVKGAAFAGTVCRHPWRGKGYDFDVNLYPADFVTTEAGTGFVHIAPGHGEDDWHVALAHDVAIPDTVDGDGNYYAHVPLFAGKHVFKVDPDVLAALTDAGALLGPGQELVPQLSPFLAAFESAFDLLRNTPQMFISMEKNGLRKKALDAIDATQWVPAQGGATASTPWWKAGPTGAFPVSVALWGVPITVFVHKQSGDVLRDQAVIDRIAAAVAAEEGGDAWLTSPPQRFLGNDYAAEDYTQVMDIIEVWFDSGSTHAFVLEARPELKWPADLYLEGSDQHRGWFHTSLLESCGTRGRAPFDAAC